MALRNKAQVGKMLNFKLHIGNLNSSQITGEQVVICPSKGHSIQVGSCGFLGLGPFYGPLKQMLKYICFWTLENSKSVKVI